MHRGEPLLTFDARWIGPHGIGRFADELRARLPGFRPFPEAGRPMHPLDPFRAGRALRRLRPALHLTPGFNAPRGAGVPCLAVVHDLIHLDDPDESSPAKRAWYRLVLRPALRAAPAILTVSEHSRARLAAWSGVPASRIVVVGNGVAPPFGPEGPRHDEGAPYVLFVGNPKPHKNVRALLAAFARPSVPAGVRLLLAGRGLEALRPLVAAHPRAADVRIVEPADDAAIAALVRGAAVVAVPSRDEGFGLVALEAMACGRPVVAAAAGALPEVVGDAALLVPPDDPDAIAAALARILADDALAARLGAAAAARAARFRWDDVAVAVRRVVDAVLAQRRDGVEAGRA